MLDISKHCRDERLVANDPEGNNYELEPWSPHRAQQRADREGIGLTEEHWSVLFSIREIHRQRGDTLTAREISRQLETAYESDGGRRFLYELFPGGPVTQGSRIAGVPIPPHSVDRSFGSVW